MANHTILIVEDNENLQDYLEEILSPHYQVVKAENGRAALEFLEENSKTAHRSPLILSDIMMPVMDGFQLLEQLKGDDRFRHLPVIMLTARADMQDKLQALRIGVDDYLLKPFEEEELLARIKNLLYNFEQRNGTAGVLDITGTGTGDQNPALLSKKSSSLSLEELQWLETLEKTVLKNLSDSRFNTEFIAQEMALSRRQLQRRLQQLAGLAPNEYIREIRLHEARRLLETRTSGTVKAVSYAVGYADPEYFSGQFRERFGKLPSEYLS